MTSSDLIDLNGVVYLRSELLADGYTDQQIRRCVRAGVLHRIRHGAYVESDLWRSLNEVDQHRVLSRAVLRTAHPDTVLSHLSAVLEHGGATWGLPLDTVHTSRTRPTKAGRRQRDWVPHRGVLPLTDVEIVNGVPVTRPPRAAVELTTIAPVEASLVAVNDLLVAGKLTPREFADFAHACERWPNSLRTDLVVRLARPGIESTGETRTFHLCWRQHLPMPTPQVVVRDEHGRPFARVDFAWPEYGVFLEFDGQEKYRRFRRPGETLEQYVMREKRREERICALTGWVCLRITWADLQEPARTAARIRRVLESRTGVAV